MFLMIDKRPRIGKVRSDQPWGILRHVFDSDAGEPFLARVGSPILVMCGSEDDEPPEAWLEQIRTSARGSAGPRAVIVDGADHDYTDRTEEATRETVGWLAAAGTGKQLTLPVGARNCRPATRQRRDGKQVLPIGAL